jgi:hypothetical protein
MDTGAMAGDDYKQQLLWNKYVSKNINAHGMHAINGINNVRIVL